ncbi:hypothetical protein EDF58_1184 [Novosphingobium sp. PhB57]|jgi:hypothetical protein|uniref:hypothetical protein n=1 Tax=Novosphingobium sp. PhB57 TaxID=2485107 RepID=UPI0010D34E92|nr:hypothetical protein [Novosphingobium sp. PhB57]TCU51831.1 hypothetical protein EDF58_1184 [Novosphingobium sp. PhB57]
METIKQIRDAVASELESRGLDNRKFLREIRAGKRDDGPYMIGALAATRLAEQSAKSG